jgi:hypothetical protein
MARRSGKANRKPRIKVGDRVYFPFSPSPMAAEVIEDRGDLGRDGEQIVRVRYFLKGGDLEPEVIEETELPVSSLVPPPDPNAAPPRRSRRRRPAPA